MKTLSHLFLLGILCLMSACASLPFAHQDWSPEAGRAQAHRDLTAGHPRICWSGTRGTYALGVEGARQEALVAGLPEWHLPSGCTDPQVGPAMSFGLAYNREVLARLSAHR